MIHSRVLLESSNNVISKKVFLYASLLIHMDFVSDHYVLMNQRNGVAPILVGK